MKKIRVLIADDYPVLRGGIRSLFEARPGFVVVGEADTGLKAVSEAERLKPDLIIMDIIMPGLDGIKAVERIIKQSPDIKIIVFSMHDDRHYAIESLKAGAKGYVIKGSDSSELFTAVNNALSGRLYVSPLINEALLADIVRGKGNNPLDVLSGREKEVLRRIVDGLKVKTIAEELFVSESAIKKHRSNIMRKLDIDTVADLVRIAIKSGLLKD